MEPNDYTFRQIAEQANDLIVITDTRVDEGGPWIVFVNRAFETHTGYSRDEVIGCSPRFLQGEATSRAAIENIRDGLLKGKAVESEMVNYRRDGTPYWVDLRIVPIQDDDGRITHYASIARDISERKKLEDDLYAQANTDPLTETANRRALLREMRSVCRRCRTDGCKASLIMIDIDRFKIINDHFGHETGDEILKTLSAACGGQIRSSDMIGRIGGEEFAILLPGTDSNGARNVAERLRNEVSKAAVDTLNDPVDLSISCGVTEFDPFTDATIDPVLKRADTALYTAKENGRNRVEMR